MQELTFINSRSEAPGTYSFGVPGSYKHKTALYQQVLNNITLKPGQLVLELSCPDEGQHEVQATILGVHPDPMGGKPVLFGISGTETGFGNGHSQSRTSWVDGSFDVIICLGIFNLMTDHSGTMTEIHRLLIPGGKVIIADQWFRRTGPMFANLLQQYGRNNDSRIYSPAWVSRLLKKNRFGEVEILASGPTNFLCTGTAIK
ncbi:MAG: class I SAM-dependent methyltransferase [Lentimicrobium sp.]